LSFFDAGETPRISNATRLEALLMLMMGTISILLTIIGSGYTNEIPLNSIDYVTLFNCRS
jgi:hypothetical protein